MGILEHVASGRQLELETETTVGRSPRAVLSLPHSFVSAQHACLHWTAEGWRVRDLGSRNGTWVDGRRLANGELVILTVGSSLRFGSSDDAWELTDGAPPRAMLKPLLPGSLPVILDSAPVSLPSEERTLASVFWQNGDLILETDSDRRKLSDGDMFEVEGSAYALRLAGIPSSTTHAAQGAARARDTRLIIRASQNEEHVAISVLVAGKTHELRDRFHNYLVLLLARQRLADRRAAVRESDEGWMTDDDVCHKLRIDRQQLNTDIYRIRKQFGEIGLNDSAQVIERRSDSRETRLGSPHVEVTDGTR